MQSAFVLCRLFKKSDGKPDEMAESSNCDEVEKNVSSPTVGKPYAEDTPSEPETPIVSGQPQMQSVSTEWCGDENNKKTCYDYSVTMDHYNNGYVADEAEGQVLDSMQVRLEAVFILGCIVFASCLVDCFFMCFGNI